MRPAGAIFMSTPGRKNPVGRFIRWRQGEKASHTGYALGDGTLSDSTLWWVKVRPDDHWPPARIEWWVPREPLTELQAEQAQGIAEMAEGRIKYGLWRLVMYMLRGVPGYRGHTLVCTGYVAYLLKIVQHLDVSGSGQPYNVDLRELRTFLSTPGGPYVKMED